MTIYNKDIPFTRTYTANSNSYTDSGSKRVKAANNFNGGGIKPYHSGTSDNYYAIVKPGNISTQQLKCAANIANGWAKAPVTPKGTRRNMWSHTVQSDSTVIFMARAYSYTGSVQTFTVTSAGKYKIEVYGSQGGNSSGSVAGGKGGYSKGIFKNVLSEGAKLYVCVGGVPYNGGGVPIKNSTQNYSGGAYGGGASHVATTNRGELKNYKSYQSEVLLVAGGGGGLDFSGTPGDGGGESGTQGTLTNSQGTSNSGGISVMNSGDGPNIIAVNGSFGQGGYAVGTWHNNADAGGCGGGGWYGGGGISTAGCGGGGSGHINTALIESGKMETGVRQGYGYILITQIRHN